MNPFSTEGVVMTDGKPSHLTQDLDEALNCQRLVINSLSVPIELYDSAGSLLHANRAALELFGIPKLSDILGLSLFSSHQIPDEKRVKLNRGDVIQFDVLFDFEKVKSLSLFPTSHVGTLWLKVRICPITKNGVIIDGYLVETRDISQQARTENEKSNLKVQLQHSDRLASIGTLAAGVAHEINNPLAIIKGNLFFLKKSADATTLPILDMQEKAVDRIAKIVNALRTYARPASNTLEVVNIHQTTLETLTLLAPLFKKQKIVFDTIFNSVRPLTKANLGRLQQVLMNLLTNARDALETKDGPRNILIETADVEGGIELAISDDGPGIEPAVIDHIFDPFFTTKPVGKGTGLGLSICQSIVKDFNGTIRVFSTLGIGTQFSILLPALSAAETALPGAIAPDNPVIQKKFTGKILLVDDEDDIRKILRRFLEQFGLTVVEAGDGDVALEILRKQSDFNFLLTDIKMGRLNGDALMREVRQLYSFDKIRILAITGGVMEDTTEAEKKNINTYADGVIQKPFSAEDIYTSLEGVLQKRTPGLA